MLNTYSVRMIDTTEAQEYMYSVLHRACSCAFMQNTYLYCTTEAAEYTYSVFYRATPSVFSIKEGGASAVRPTDGLEYH